MGVHGDEKTLAYKKSNHKATIAGLEGRLEGTAAADGAPHFQHGHIFCRGRTTTPAATLAHGL